MALDPLTAGIELATKLAGKLADRFLPSTMGEAEKHAARMEMEKLALEEYKTAIADVQGARELAQKDAEGAPGWSKALAATHRPAWSFTMLGIFLWTVVAPYLNYPTIELSSIHKDIMQTVIIFYFGGRSVEKTITIIKGAKS